MADGLKIGDRLGDFEILSIAGAGGMGVVYKARQQSLDRDVALKLIRDEIAGDPEFRERFLREAKLAASVNHPNVVTVYDVRDEDGKLYLVMQWIDGSDLRHLLDDSGRLTPKRAIAIGKQLAGALDALHGVSGLVHRDVKPGNVLLREVAGEDHAYLTDFGIAKPPDAAESLTRTGSTVGTTCYLSPEQIQGKDAGPRSDLYSLGCVVFEMLTGRTPFTGENDLAIRWAHASDTRPLVSTIVPALGHRYDAFFQTALAIDPEDRFGSGQEFAETLAAAQGSSSDSNPTAVMAETHAVTLIGPTTPVPPRPVSHTPPPYGYPTPAPPHRDDSGSPLALILLAIVAVVGIAAAALVGTGVFDKESGSPSARTVAEAGGGSTPNKGKSTPYVHKPKQVKPPAGASPCAGSQGLWVNAVTSCPFAKNTRSAYAEADGAHEIEVYSPVTDLTYEMTCNGSALVTCTGGKGGEVYFTSAKATGQDTTPIPTPEPEPEPEPTPEPTTSGASRSCDQNISANGVTSCPFAENVFVAYWEEWEKYGDESYSYVEAFSPTTGESYGMECTLGGGIVDCSGGTEAFVTFPIQAVREY